MAICTNCGAKLPDGSKFCFDCGRPIAVGTDIPIAKTEEELPIASDITEDMNAGERLPDENPAEFREETAIIYNTTDETEETPETYNRMPASEETPAPASYPVQPIMYAPPPIPVSPGTTVRIEEPQEAPYAPAQNKKPAGRRLLGLWIALGVVALAGIIATVLFLVLPVLGNGPAPSSEQGEADAVLSGLWTARSAFVGEEEIPLSSLGLDSFTILLEETGSAVVTVNDVEYTATWRTSENGVALQGYYGLTKLELKAETLEGDYLGTGILIYFRR